MRIAKLLGIVLIGLYVVISGFVAIAGYLDPKPPAQMSMNIQTAYITNPQCMGSLPYGQISSFRR